MRAEGTVLAFSQSGGIPTLKPRSLCHKNGPKCDTTPPVPMGIDSVTAAEIFTSDERHKSTRKFINAE
jgi:hypothetical protein